MSYQTKPTITQNVSEIIVCKLFQQKRFFANVRLKYSMVHYKLMPFDSLRPQYVLLTAI